MIKCIVCNKDYASKETLRIHVKSQHGENEEKTLALRIYSKDDLTDADRLDNYLDKRKDQFDPASWKRLKWKARAAKVKEKRKELPEVLPIKPPDLIPITGGKRKSKPMPPHIKPPKKLRRSGNKTRLLIKPKGDLIPIKGTKRKINLHPPHINYPKRLRHEIFGCNFCGQRFSDNKHLAQHINDKHPTCFECGEQFIDLKAYEDHWNDKHEKESPKHPIVESEEDSDDEGEYRSSSELPPLPDDSDETESNDDRVAIPKRDKPLEDDSDETQSNDDRVAIPKRNKDDIVVSDGETIEILSDREEKDVEYDRVIPISEDEDIHLPNKKHRCGVCTKSFKTRSLLNVHMRNHAKIKNNYRCRFCNKKFKSSNELTSHIESKHNFECKTCKTSFEEADQLLEHISIDHPRCKVCGKRFTNTARYLNHYQTVHQNEEADDSEPNVDLPPASEDEMSDEEDPRAETKREDKMFHKHINCVTIERFLKIRQVIANNQFESLVNDKQLMEALQIILKGVVKGYIPICTTQRIILTKEMKKLMYSFVRRPSSTKILRNKHNLKMLFDVIWTSVKAVIDSFLQYEA